MRHESNGLLLKGKTIALVPTMGYLHDGHLALVRQGRELADVLVVSIFVNPTQFGPGEDLNDYPRDLNRDIELLAGQGVDFVFAPDAASMYERNSETFIDQRILPNHLCGVCRPAHFRGVLTVVTKLFNIVKPNTAVFGEKDFQQLAVIRRMVQDLNFDIKITSVPIVRESDGLAMSSRNVFLTSQQRVSAQCLYAALQKAKVRVAQGERNSQALIDELIDFIQSHLYTTIDYVSLCNVDTLESIDRIKGATLLALAVRVGTTRLIDNAVLTP